MKYKFQSAFFNTTVALLLYVFVVLNFDALVVDKLGSATDKNSMAVLYSVAIAIVGLGVILFPVSKVFVRSENGRTKYIHAVVLSGAAFIFFSSVLIFSSNLSFIALSCFLTALSMGYLGGWMFWSMSMFLSGTLYAGRTIGISILTATLALNYCTNFLKTNTVQLLVIASFTTVSITITNRLWGTLSPVPLLRVNDETTAFDKGLLSIAVVVLMTVLGGISNGFFLKIYSADKTYTMHFYQAIHGVSAFVFGFLYDFRKRATLLLSALFIIFFSCSPFLLSFPGRGTLYGVITWTYGGLFCLLYLLPFIEIAPRTRFPELWASCGAIARYLVTGLVIIPTALLVEFIDNKAIVAINVIIAALLLRTLYLSNNKTDFSGDEADEDTDDDFFRSFNENASVIISDENQLSNIAKFVEKHGLSPKEAKALMHIIHSQETLKDISRKEKISERTFQRYLTKIYEKTGTKTRAGLVAAYHKEFSDADDDGEEQFFSANS